MAEIWKTIKGYPDYKISNKGRVKSFKRGGNGYLIKIQEDIYKQVSISCGKGYFPKRLHRLIAQAFIPNPEGKPCINHKDGDKYNNNVDNLEWCTVAENNKHAYDTGLTKPPTCMYGKDNHKTKLNEKQVRVIRWWKIINPKIRLWQISEVFGMDRSVIGDIIHRKTWKQVPINEPK